MEPTELEKNLSDLEDKIDRVRALYEQYFVGIEKLEPQIPRKDVERIMVVMRKEQIRNTAMRFKFQTLVQRFNTMQQHWGRTMREIENGTFRRDVLKAAARFGAEEALTGVGKRQAEKLKKVIEAQRERLGVRQGRKGKQEIYEEVSVSDVEMMDDVDDDAPTPPPVYNLDETYAPQGHDSGHTARDGGYPQQGVYQPQAYAQQPAVVGQPYQAQFASPYGQEPYAPAPAYAAAGAQHGQDAYAGQYQATPGRSSPIVHETALQPRQGFAAPAPAFSLPTDPLSYGDGLGGDDGARAPAPGEPVKKKGGLRWGGAGGRRADPEALKRIANLAAPEPSATESKEAPAPRRPLMSSPIDLGLPDEPTSVEPPAPPQRRPLLSSPIGLDGGSEPPPPPSARAPSVSQPTQAAAPPPPAASAERGRPQLRPPPSADQRDRPAPTRPQREFGDLNDGRLREIYGQYVQARRERNESTAGITFEKLADSLRSQADKLKGKHTSKRVDYEVVVKEGKTLIKPIVK